MPRPVNRFGENNSLSSPAVATCEGGGEAVEKILVESSWNLLDGEARDWLVFLREELACKAKLSCLNYHSLRGCYLNY